MGLLDGRDRHWRVKRDRSRHRGSIMKVGAGDHSFVASPSAAIVYGDNKQSTS